MGFLDDLTGGLLSFGGKLLEDKFIGDPNSADAYKRQKDFYKSRYQWMMKDMAKAGLNPILAAGSAGFSTSGTPSVQMSTLPSSDYSSSAKNVAEIGLIEEQSKTEKVKQMKTLQETKKALADTFKSRAEKGLVEEQERRIWFEIEKLHSETIKNLKVGFKTTAEQKMVEQNIKRLAVELQRLKNVDAIYSNPASMALSIVREIANSLGLNIGLIGTMKGK